MHYILPLIVFFLFMVEGLGVPFGRELTYFLTILLFPILFIHTLFQKKKFVFPKKATVLFVTFLVITFLSTLFSVNVSNSLQYLLLLLSIFFAFLISYNYKNGLEKPLLIVIFTLSMLFALYSLLLNFHLLNLFAPLKGYQFVFSRFGSHNHLGDFLVIPVIICIYYLVNYKSVISNQKSVLFLLSIGFCLLSSVFILFSYSRSAYLSLALTVIFMLVYLQKKGSTHKWMFRIIAIIIILITAFMIITITHQAQKQPLSSGVNKYLVQKENLRYKDLLGERTEYTHQALLSFQKHPLIGIGPNNFLTASLKYKSPFVNATETAHNIFLEILVGQGILGLLPFAGLILLILIKSRKNALYFAMLAMLINFQTDYTYQMYSFLLLFFILSGIMMNEKNPPFSLDFRH